MWRVLMAVLAGAILAQADLDAGRGASGAGEEVASDPGELLPAASTKTPCKCVPRCKPHETCTTFVRDPSICYCTPKI